MTTSERSPTPQRRIRGVTLIELMIVVAIFGVLTAAAVPSMSSYFENQRLRDAARGVADLMLLARAEAIRTGANHLVVLQGAHGATNPSELQATFPVVVVNDGPPTTADCELASSEIVHRYPAVEGISWGTTSTLANATTAPFDLGAAPATVTAGSTFTDASQVSTAKASWVLFQADGLPRLFTPSAGGGCDAISTAGVGGGGIYLTNTARDYAVVLSPLGGVRVHQWNRDANGGAGAWMQ